MRTELSPGCSEQIDDAAIQFEPCVEDLGSKPEINMEPDCVRPGISGVATNVDSVNKKAWDINEASNSESNTTKEGFKEIIYSGFTRMGIATTGGTGVFSLALLALASLYCVVIMQEMSNQVHREMHTNYPPMYTIIATVFFNDEIRAYQDVHKVMIRSLLYFTTTTLVSGVAMAYIVLFPNKNLIRKKIAGWILMGVALINFMVFPSGWNTWIGMVTIILPLMTASILTLNVVQGLEKKQYPVL